MKNALKKHNNRFILIGKINGLSEESKKARTRIKKVEAEKKWPIINRKRLIGVSTRHHLLAYAFLRGIPYHKLEAKCADGNAPNSHEIFKVVETHAPTWLPYDSYTKTGGGTYKVSLEDVQNWISEER